MDALILKVDGQQYAGWKEVSIERGIEQIAGQLRVAVTDKWPNQVEPRPIVNGAKVEVLIGADLIMTGYVDKANPSFDERSTRFEVVARDVTADLADCSAQFKTGQWRNSTIKQIATDLISAYKIELVITPNAEKAATAKIGSFNIEEGETVFDCLDRLCKIKALMMWTVGDGKLIIGLPGQNKSEVGLEQGVNLLRLTPELSQAERYSEYIVKGQGRAVHGKKSHALKDTVKDTAITRHRPLIILAEDHNDGHTPHERAVHEQITRMGKGNRMSARVQGWRQKTGGALWLPGLLVSVDSDYCRYHGELRIARVVYIKSENEGTVCDLELADAHAFDRLSENKQDKTHKAKKRGRSHKRTEKDMGAL